MSYARWGWDGSDVYLFTTSKGTNQYAIECCGCLLDRGIELEHPYTDKLGITHTHEYTAYQANTSGEMIAHLKKHLAMRHCVPEDVIPNILQDYPDENKTITEYENQQNILKENK